LLLLGPFHYFYSIGPILNWAAVQILFFNPGR
jgi:hypothetical protein